MNRKSLRGRVDNHSKNSGQRTGLGKHAESLNGSDSSLSDEDDKLASSKAAMIFRTASKRPLFFGAAAGAAFSLWSRIGGALEDGSTNIPRAAANEPAWGNTPNVSSIHPAFPLFSFFPRQEGCRHEALIIIAVLTNMPIILLENHNILANSSSRS